MARLNSKLHIFLGKGGVGKTTVALAHAAAAAQEGRRTLYIEIGEKGAAGTLLHRSSLRYKPCRLAKNLFGSKITGNESIRDYLLRQIRVEKLYRLFFENRPVRYFFEVAPTLRDLTVLAKIVHDLESTEDPGPFDEIVVDAPATGHGIFMLRTPHVVRELTRVGPVFDRALRILDTLTDKKKTSVHVVTLARPLVVGETLELLGDLAKTSTPLGRLFVNRVLFGENRFSQKEIEAAANSGSQTAVSLLAQRGLSERAEVRQLRRRAGVPLTLLPENSSLSNLEALAAWKQQAVSDD